MTSLPVQKPFPVLKLPSEIRRCIWTYVVVKDGYLFFRNHTEVGLVEFDMMAFGTGEPSEPRRKDAESRSLLAVAFTCRQIYLEVAPIYYGENTFCPSYLEWWLGHYKVCQRFTEAIGLGNANTITDFNVGNLSWTSVDQLIMLLPNVKRLRFDKCEGSQELKDMTSLAKRYKSVTLFYGGEVWGPDKWSLYPEAN